MQQIRLSTQKVMSSFSEIDQSTGRRILRMNDRRMEIMLQKERD